MGSTSARHFVNLSDAIYRFVPIDLMPQDIYRVLGDDERLAVVSYERAVNYYKQLIINSDTRIELHKTSGTSDEL